MAIKVFCKLSFGLKGSSRFEMAPMTLGEAVGLVDEVTEFPLQVQGFGGEAAGGFDGAGVFGAQSLNPGGGQRLFLASDALYFRDQGVGIKLGRGEEFVGGLFDFELHSQ